MTFFTRLCFGLRAYAEGLEALKALGSRNFNAGLEILKASGPEAVGVEGASLGRAQGGGGGGGGKP